MADLMDSLMLIDMLIGNTQEMGRAAQQALSVYDPATNTLIASPPPAAKLALVDWPEVDEVIELPAATAVDVQGVLRWVVRERFQRLAHNLAELSKICDGAAAEVKIALETLDG